MMGCGLYYKSFAIVIYNRKDNGQYYKTTIIAKASLSQDYKLQLQLQIEA